jgi:hypothetical protein
MWLYEAPVKTKLTITAIVSEHIDDRKELHKIGILPGNTLTILNKKKNYYTLSILDQTFVFRAEEISKSIQVKYTT